jgi:bacillithiol biosynthesis cysteine-adding enzyme BshC
MNAHHYPIQDISKPDSLVLDYLNNDEKINSLISVVPSLESFEHVIANRTFDAQKRATLVEVLKEQYKELSCNVQVENNISNLALNNTYTVTTGHQLCLFTGPLYFVYKILSTIKLAARLQERYPSYNFVPVYWMATEDHDLAEINHAYFYNKKLTWQTEQTGPVGPMRTSGINEVIDELIQILGSGPRVTEIESLLRKSYQHATLAEATRYLVNELFGTYGLVVVDGNDARYKTSFLNIIRKELYEHQGYNTIDTTNAYLHENGYKVQVNPREVNLFYMKDELRSRIDRVSDNQWKVVDTGITFDKTQLEQELENHPERFSPNVALRPIYQETILPNLAYIGGPGELAYWLQLKAFFNKAGVSYPALILRDSVLLISQKIQSRLQKLELSPKDLFADVQETIKRLVHSEQTSLDEDRNVLHELFEGIAAKLKAIDPTLEATARAEGQKQINAIDHLEKKAIKALKTKEEQRIQSYQKIHQECFPDGTPQERHDNYFQHYAALDADLLSALYDSLAPMEKQYHLMLQ